MDLKEIRDNIDKIDREVIELLEKRMNLALNAKKLKTKIEDKSREGEIFKRLKDISKDSPSSEFYLKMYELIIKESKRRQKL